MNAHSDIELELSLVQSLHTVVCLVIPTKLPYGTWICLSALLLPFSTPMWSRRSLRGSKTTPRNYLTYTYWCPSIDGQGYCLWVWIQEAGFIYSGLRRWWWHPRVICNHTNPLKSSIWVTVSSPFSDSQASVWLLCSYTVFPTLMGKSWRPLWSTPHKVD